MIQQTDIEQLKPYQARKIIEGLRKGIVPSEYVTFFTVGRQNWIKYIEEDLEQYIAHGGSKVRFINGSYGDGKTHFMSVIQHLAVQAKFASSFVVLTREIPIHKFEIVYQQLVAQLKGSFEGTGLRSLLRHWLEECKNQIDAHNSLETEAFFEQLRQLPGMDLNFAQALIALFKAEYQELSENEAEQDCENNTKELLLSWFEGQKIAKKDLKPYQIFDSLNKTNSKVFLSSLIAFLRFTGHNGLILLLDELETVLAQAASVRNAAYENVRLLIDNMEDAHHLHIFFSIIPDVLLAEKGFKSYDALWSRVRTIGQADHLNYRSTLVDLHRTPLQTKELIHLGINLRRIHELAYRWDAKEVVKETLISDICEKQEKSGVLSEVRLFIKQIIRYLDLYEQNEGLGIDLSVAENMILTQKENELEKARQLEPAWDA